jgi:hypothetical protein
MPGKAATAKAIEKATDDVDAYEMVNLNIGRVDGVDEPAHGRQFLLIKSAAGVVEKDDEAVDDDVTAEHDAIAEAAEKCLIALAQDKAPLTSVQVDAVKFLAGALGMPEDDIEIVPAPEPEEKKPTRTRKSKGGSMTSTKARVRKAEADAEDAKQQKPEDDEEMEEAVDQLNEEDADEEDADEPEDAVGTTAEDDEEDEENEEEGEKQPVTAEKARGNNGKMAGPGQKMPTKAASKNAAKVPTKARTRKSADAELETIVANAVANAMAGPFEALTAAIQGLQPAQKSARRPVSQQAKGQDDVRKSATPAMGEGLFTNIVYPE